MVSLHPDVSRALHSGTGLSQALAPMPDNSKRKAVGKAVKTAQGQLP
jgi:hypothetical protein